MSSTIPYDPDDFDNNPFAEPNYPPVLGDDTQQQGQIGDTTNAYQPQQDSYFHDEPLVTEPLSTNTQKHNEEEHQEETQQANTTASSKVTDEDIELLPERYDGRQSEYQNTVKVTGIERYGSFATKRENPNILFDFHTNIKSFKSKNYKNIKKSYAEFQTFYKLLNESIPEVFVQSLPPPSTSYGIANEKDYFKTIKSFQEWFTFVAENPILQRLPELQYFIESDYNSYQPISKFNHTASGLKRKTLKQLQPPYDECLELAEFRPLIKSIYRDCKSILETLERLVRTKKNIGGNESTMGNRIAELKSFEVGHLGMAKLWESFGKTMNIVGDLDTILGSLEFASLGDGLNKIMEDTYIIKESLTDRHLIMRDLITAQQNTKLKHEAASKLRNKRDINPIKVNDAIESLNEAIQSETELTKKVQRITKEMLIEKSEIMKMLDLHIKSIFKEYINSKIEYERKKLMILEKLRINVRSVDSNGGLSRLGRENYPKTDPAATVKPSQGKYGDSWSGSRKTSHYNHADLTSKVDAFEQLHSSKNVGEADGEDHGDNQITARNAASLLGTSTF